jgi:hypothetical protein
MTDKLTAQEHRDAAARAEQEAFDSFERCDTDGFLSQWASGLTAQLHRRQADLEDAGGVAEFWALYDAETGERIRAKLIDGQYGLCWALCDANDKFTGTFYKSKYGEGTARTKMAKAGLVERRDELVAAKAVMQGKGTGLSGTAWVATVRCDKGYPDDAVVR